MLDLDRPLSQASILRRKSVRSCLDINRVFQKTGAAAAAAAAACKV
jgi:hypothetical protein